MKIVAWQETPNGKIKLAIKTYRHDMYKIVIVENIHGLDDILSDIPQVTGSDIDAMTEYLYSTYHWNPVD
jgi:hypothetical protein